MTDRDVVERVAHLVGRALVVAHARDPRYRVPYLVSVKGLPAIELMRAASPELSIIRQRQIARVIARWSDARTAADRPPRASRAPLVTLPVPHECDETCERGWVAGLLEGEGSFASARSNGRAYPVIALEMCAEDVVDRMRRSLAAKWMSSRSPDKGNWNVTFATSIGGAAAAEWMRRLRPFMGERRRAAIDAALAAYTPIRLTDPPKTCVVPGCDEPHRARGLCHKHYMNWTRDVAKGRTPRITPLR